MSDTQSTQPATNITAPRKKKIPWTLIIVPLILIPLLSASFAKYYFSFRAVTPKYYRDTFFSWRVLYADKCMYNTVWKFIESNKYDEKSKYAEFVKMMQTDGLLYDAHPEHFPRGHKFYDTHETSHEFNMAYLKMRSDMSAAFDDKLDKKIFEGKVELSDKKIMYWVGKKGNLIGVLKDHPRMVKFMQKFYPVLVKLVEGKYKEKIGKVDDKGEPIVPKEMVDDLMMLAKEAKIEVSEDFMKTVPVSLGKALGVPLINFCYSRLFYLFYFFSLDADLDLFHYKNGESEEEAKKKEKDAGKPVARITVVARCFSNIIKEMFDGDQKTDKETVGSWEYYMMNWFGTHKSKVNIDETENIKILMESIEKKLEGGELKA